MNEYGFNPTWSDEQRRLALLERCWNPPTIAKLKRAGVGPGWRCLEVGAGNGSIARWLRDAVRPNGRVVAVDLDTRFIANEPSIEARQANILTDEIEPEAFDLVHCRALLHHLPGNEVAALKRMTAALRPGGFLLAEEPYSGPMIGSRTPAWAALWQAFVAAMPHADYIWPLSIGSAFRAAGLTDIEVSGAADVIQGGTPEAEFLRLTVEAVRNRLPPNVNIEPGIQLLRDPHSFEPGFVVYCALGRKAQ
ncbi:MAG: class I SAM-dependent methyltransferase [Rhodocyclaceae bacterium]|nr:class I SAM-dependent methyltransferase [Rhodocyclaceae bacterium]MBX3666930.1 class I SAM-dependent methyltransferase [Rhodocyclaceae bacterium]